MSLNRVGYLQILANKFGDFKVARATKFADDQIIWTKHRSVLECWESEEGLLFLAKCNNRSSHPAEIILDLDKEPFLHRLNFICDILEEYRFSYKAHFSGSKGYHAHVLIRELALHPRWFREKIRAFLINKLGCDLMKKSESSMIALEGVPHWRTGKMKTLVRCWG